MVYEYFLKIMIEVGKIFGLLASCYILKEYHTNVTHPEDTEFLKFRINDLNSKMKESLVNALALVDKYESYVSYSDTTSVVYLPFLNVLQLIFESEVNLSSSKTCSDDCEQFKSQQYSRNGCYGNIHDCMFKVPVNTSVEQSISNDPYRIYEGYFYDGQWYGKHGGPKELSQTSMKSWNNGINICNACQCTCDNHNAQNTSRRLYSGKVHTNQKGYVITGVRFERVKRVIFLNIQIGQLISMGFVDQATVNWKKAPDDIEYQYIEFGYNMRKFSNDIVNFKSLILTGIQFVKINDSVRLRGFAKKVDNFYTGAMLEREEVFTNNYKLKGVSMKGRKPEIKF